MNRSYILILFLAFSSPAYALDPIAHIQQSLAAAEGVDESLFDKENIWYKSTPEGIRLKYSRNLGEGGDELHEAQFRADGTLASEDIELDYIEHSMGATGNRRFYIWVQRSFDSAGNVSKVRGRMVATRLSNKKILEKREIASPQDEALGQLSKPLLKLDDELLAALLPKSALFCF